MEATVMRPLPSLLLPPIPTVLRSPSAVNKWCTGFASWMMNNVVLVIADRPHRLVEVELYITEPTLHPDPFTHGQPQQHTSASFYFHSRVNQKTGVRSYLEGAFAGLDITFGNQSTACGLLIRSLEDLKGKVSKEFPFDSSCGPGQCSERIRKLIGVESTKELVQVFDGDFSACDTSKIMYLQKAEDYFKKPLAQRAIYTSPRVGLFLTKTGIPLETQTEYAFRNYRFISAPRIVWKGKHYLVAALYLRGETPKSITAIVEDHKMKFSDIKKIIDIMHEGATQNRVSEFVGRRLTDEETLRLMGCLYLVKS